MKDVVSFISSISVLIASLAGIFAINKWRLEKLDKSKIEAFENYEMAMEKVKILISSFLHEANVVTIHSDLGMEVSLKEKINRYYVIKKGFLDDLRKSLVEAKKYADKYSSYTGESIYFHLNYYFCYLFYMETYLFALVNNLLSSDRVEDEEFFSAIIEHDKVSAEGGFSANLKLAMVDKNISSFPVRFVSKKYILDSRQEIDYFFERFFKLEKRHLHSGLFVRFFLNLKMFNLKCRVIGRVWMFGDNHGWFVCSNGNIEDEDVKNNDIVEVEKNKKKEQFVKMVKDMLVEIFS